VTVEDHAVRQPKVQPVFSSRLARAQWHVAWLASRTVVLMASEGATGVARGFGRWASRMTRRWPGMVVLTLFVWHSRLSGKHLVVSFSDIDGLTAIDRSLGRRHASSVVEAVGLQLRAHLYPKALVFRYGGDEWVCAMPNSELLTARQLMGQARAALLKAGGPTFTTGLAELQADDTPYSVVRRAEIEMLSSKPVG
jgi:GGDEF domain-containing protein